LKLVQERTGHTPELISICNDFLSRTQMAQQLKEKNWQMGLCETKKLLHTQNTFSKEGMRLQSNKQRTWEAQTSEKWGKKTPS
jgi:hypothetical protein